MVATEKSDEKVDTCSWRLKKLSPDCRTALDEFLLEFGASKRFCAIYNSKEAGTEETRSIGDELLELCLVKLDGYFFFSETQPSWRHLWMGFLRGMALFDHIFQQKTPFCAKRCSELKLPYLAKYSSNLISDKCLGSPGIPAIGRAERFGDSRFSRRAIDLLPRRVRNVPPTTPRTLLKNFHTTAR